MKRVSLLLVFSLLVPGVFLGSTSAETIDFEGLQAGTIVYEVFGDGGSGPIEVSGINPDFSPGTNAAVIFDSSDPTGGDDDLGTPNEEFEGPGVGAAGEAGDYVNDTALGNVLIVAENLDDINGDGLVDDPDDAEVGACSITLDFSASESVTVISITIIDFEGFEPIPMVELFDQFSVLIDYFILPQTGDNGVAVVSLGPTAGVGKMVVTFSIYGGAIDNIVFTSPAVGNGGCTPGYWKQEQHFDSWTTYNPSTPFLEVFDRYIVIKWSEKGKPEDTSNPTLLQALQANGGGINALARHAVAAWLNADNPEIEYAFTTSGVITLFQAAYDSGDFESAKDILEEANEVGCPLD